ncbi:hypothetical protein GcM3_063014 [Golovinomyces cichoracearum]|uniref:Uncharacterized protein n=1 Tax=Golovinomyces cichoracearum TaxID=62708 RepID=A0A420IVH3_9PEZI|nr:hypothetical protein GcM3_063014 [Golovinomyces cichoracearum]
MPVSPLSVIITLCGSVGYGILPYLTEAHDEVSKEEGGIVLSILGLDPEKVGNLVYKISPAAVKRVNNMYHIVGIRPSIKYYNLVDPTDFELAL